MPWLPELAVGDPPALRPLPPCRPLPPRVSWRWQGKPTGSFHPGGRRSRLRSRCAAWSSASARSWRSTGSTSQVPSRRLLRAAGAERRGQVDDDADADRAGAGRRGRDRGARLRAAARVQAGADGDGRRAAAGQPRRRADVPADPDACSRACTACRAPSARRRWSARCSIANLCRAPTRSSGSSRAACAGGCWSRAG